MSHSVIYAAVLPDSTFLKRVQQEEAFRTLAYVALSARDLYGFFDSKFDFEEDLQDLIEYRGETLGVESEARLWIHTFRSELEIVQTTSPMIETRSACFESSVDSVRDHLGETITTLESVNVSDLIDHLLFGSSIYGTQAPEQRLPGGDWLGLVQLAQVKVGAEILRDISTETLFSPEEIERDWESRHFAWWKELYCAASEHNEAILVSIY